MNRGSWERVVGLLFTSELNAVSGLGDLALIAEIEAQKPTAATRKARAALAALWVFRMALVVLTIYLAVGFGIDTPAIATGGVALGLFFVSAVRAAAAVDEVGLGAGPPPGPGLLLCGYVSAINFALGLPYRLGPGPHYAWMFQILAGLVGGGLIAVWATTAPVLKAAWGCYAAAPIEDLGGQGVCPQLQSAWVTGSESTCYLSRGAIPIGSHCQTLPWADTILSGLFQAARTTTAVAIGVYAASFGRVYDTAVAGPESDARDVK